MFCVIIPAYNEEDHIKQVIWGLLARIPADQIVVIDDGSSDNTQAIAEATGVKVISHYKNFGVGAAIASGIQAAYTSPKKFEYTVIMAGDGQHRVEDLDAMLKPLEERRADFVQGTRYESFGWRTGFGSGKFHRIGPLLMSILFWICTGRWFHDPGNGFKAFKSDLFSRHNLSRGWLEGFSLEPALLYWASQEARVEEVKVVVPFYPKSTIRWKLWREMMRVPIWLKLGIK